MTKLELQYEGKSKKIYSTDSKERIIIQFKDDATAFYGIKHAQIENKGSMNCAISSMLLGWLNANGIKTHFVEQLSEDTQLCGVVEHLPFEVPERFCGSEMIIGNYSDGEPGLRPYEAAMLYYRT